MILSVMNKETYELVSKRISLVLKLSAYLVVAGLAFSGLGVMGFSLLMWLFSGLDTISGFGILTGGVFLSTATVLFFGRLLKEADSFQRRFPVKVSDAKVEVM